MVCHSGFHHSVFSFSFDILVRFPSKCGTNFNNRQNKMQIIAYFHCLTLLWKSESGCIKPCGKNDGNMTFHTCIILGEGYSRHHSTSGVWSDVRSAAIFHLFSGATGFMCRELLIVSVPISFYWHNFFTSTKKLFGNIWTLLLFCFGVFVVVVVVLHIFSISTQVFMLKLKIIRMDLNYVI